MFYPQYNFRDALVETGLVTEEANALVWTHQGRRYLVSPVVFDITEENDG